MNIRTATRAAAIATALITMSFGATACSSAEGSAGSDTQVYVKDETAHQVLFVDGAKVIAVEYSGSPEQCTQYKTLLEQAQKGTLDADLLNTYSESDRDNGQLNEARSTILWDGGSTQAIAFNTPLDNTVTTGELLSTGSRDTIYVSVDTDRGKASIADKLIQDCDS